MDIEGWRIRIDDLDRQIVALISERARAAQAIGRLKKSSTLPVYEPNREAVIFANVRAHNPGPLPDIELTHIYERLIDVMRALQQEELASERAKAVREDALAAEVLAARTMAAEADVAPGSATAVKTEEEAQ